MFIGAYAGLLGGAHNNVGIGYKAMGDDTKTTAADDNTAVGTLAMRNLTSGSDNCAFGYNSLAALTSGSRATAVGMHALSSNTTANDNVAVGQKALENATTGGANVALGTHTLRNLTTSANNTAIGKDALNQVTTGTTNTAVGANAGDAITTANNSTCVGHTAVGAITTGHNNQIFGQNAVTGITNGTTNSLFGSHTCQQLTTGSNNGYFGAFATCSANNVGTEFVIGYNVAGKGGDSFFAGSNGGAFQGNNSSSWSTTSDKRIKKNIVSNTVGLDALNKIQVKNFEYKTEEEIVIDNPELADVVKSAVVSKKGLQLGVIAQELETILPECVITKSTGIKTVNPDNFTWYLINAIKELSAKVTALEAG